MGSKVRLSEQIEEWFGDALEPFVLQDDWTWEVSFVLTPQGPMFMLMLAVPGVIIGSKCMSMVAIPPLPDRSMVTEAVVHMVQQVNEERDKPLAGAQDPAGPHMTTFQPGS